ncbi:hypothetical protein [Kitasatospora sp. NPDC058190]|uniref:hypothetical protein n=1 Tax=Kitasatospora sp. NPDC058190 TaxID=3346371 RepID=UPI0036DF6F75
MAAMPEAIHFNSIFKSTPGERHVRVTMDGAVVFDGNMIDEGETQTVDVTKAMETPAHVQLGIVTDDGAFHACRYFDESCSNGAGPCPFEMVVLPQADLFPGSPAQFDAETTTGLPPFGGGAFELSFRSALL